MHDLVAELDVVRNADQPSDGFLKSEALAMED